MRNIWTWYLNLGLWPRVAISVSLGFFALFLAFAVLGEQALLDSIAHLRDERLVIAQMAAGQVDNHMKQVIAALDQAAKLVNAEDENFDLAEVAHELEVEGEINFFSAGLILLDAEGRSISSYPPELFPRGSDLSGLSYVTQALELNQITISDPFQDPVDGQPVLAITVPLDDANGRLQGLVGGLVPLNGGYLTSPLNQATSLQESEHAVLFDREGRVIVSTFSLPLFSPGEHQSWYRRKMAEGKPAVETVVFELDIPGEPEGHKHVMAFVPLENVSWGLAVGGDEDDFLAGIQRLRKGLAVLGIGALIAIWVSTLIGTRSLVRPVQRLTVAADQIADGNLDASLSAPEGGEISVMAAALDRMRSQLIADNKALVEWNDKLEERVAAQTEDLRRQQTLTQQLLGKLLNAQEDERSRLARELHDEIGQALTGIELSLGHLANALLPENKEAHQRLEQSRTMAQWTTAELRAIIAALRPGTLDQLGLLPALEWISDHTLRSNEIAFTIEAEGLDGRLPREIETTLFRIAQEAINNVARHSQATTLTISLLAELEAVTMILCDNGQGFTTETGATGHRHEPSLGIEGMKERASLAGGELFIESKPDIGTTLRVTIPIPTRKEQGEDMTNQLIRLIVVDDHAIMREGLVKLLEEEPDLQIVGLASTGQEAIDLVHQKAVDVVLLDIVMEDMNGLEAARQILSAKSEIKVIILTMYEEKAFLQEALQVGASGYFLKGSNSTELVQTIRTVHRGGTYLSPKLANALD